MKHKKPRHPVRYHLRACLTADHWREEEAALWRIINRAAIDEVMFFVPHAEERSPGLGTPAENAAVIERLRPVFDRLREEQVAPSLNMWWTVAFSSFPDYPRRQRDGFDFRPAVALDGRESTVAACPACPAWRSQVRDMVAAFAALRPVRLWIDDDVRMTLRADMGSPCFCPACLAELQRRSGQPQQPRTDWLAAIMADPPNPVRNAWLDYQQALERDLLAMLAGAVHQVSPETQVCLMHSTPESHEAEGRRWRELTDALGSPRPMLRPSIGPYTDTTGAGIAEAYNTTRLSQAAVPPKTLLAPEIENYPHSRFGKSVAVVAANLEMAQWLGIPEITLSIYRFGGRLDLETMRGDPWSELLERIKPRLQALADLNITPNQLDGVALTWHEDLARHTRGLADERQPHRLSRRRAWDTALPLMGIAVRHGKGSITAISGEEINALNETERQRIFSGAVLLDGRAAAALVRLGAGRLAGAVQQHDDATATMEIITDAAIGGIAGDVINLRWTSRALQFDWLPGARVVSHLLGYESQPRGHGVVLFENELGGRVITVPYDGQATGNVAMGVPFPPLTSPSFLCLARAAQLRDALQWAHRTPLPLTVTDQPMVYPLLARQKNRRFVAAVNLSPDPVSNFTFRLPTAAGPVSRIRCLGPTGAWRRLRHAEVRACGPDRHQITTGQPLHYLETIALLLDDQGGD